MPVPREKLLGMYADDFAPGIGHVLNIEVANRIILDIKQILDGAGIPFWLWFGTFLGVYREGRLLPWDGDMDLAAYAEDEARIVEHEAEFSKRGFEMGTGGNMLLLYREHEHADFYFFRDGESKRIWRDYSIEASDFETPNTIEFLGKTWRIVSNPESWLAYLYGADWRTPKYEGV